jgi:hypothetical protein
MTVNENSVEAAISPLHPYGPSPSFVYPQQPDILSIPLSEVVMKVDPRKATGRTCTLTSAETQLTIGKFKHKRTY